MDDYKFEVLWNNPEPRIKKLAQYRAVLTPQYSLYTEKYYDSAAIQYVQKQMGRRLFAISGHYSHTNCLLGNTAKLLVLFDGLETGSIVAVSTLGLRTEKELFMHGYQEMIKRVNPEAVICYENNPFDETEGNIIAVDYAKQTIYPTGRLHCVVKKRYL